MEKLKTYISTMIDLNDDEWENAIKFYTLKHFKKGETIRYTGEGKFFADER